MNKILLVSSSNDFIKFINNILSFYNNVNIVNISNGVLVISKLKQDDFNLIIIDEQIDRYNPVDLINSIKQTKSISSIPIIFCYSEQNNYNTENLRLKSKLFLKPVDISKFINYVTLTLNIFNVNTSTTGSIDVSYNNNILFIDFNQSLNIVEIINSFETITKIKKTYSIDKFDKILIIINFSIINNEENRKIFESFFRILTEETNCPNNMIKIYSIDSLGFYEILKLLYKYKNIEIFSTIDSAIDALFKQNVLEIYSPDQLNIIKKEWNEKIEEKNKNSDNINNLQNNEIDMSIYDKLISPTIISVIDDEIDTLNYIKEVLSKYNVEIALYSDGESFLKDLQVHHTDLLFLDLFMPNMNGFQVLEKIKQKKTNFPVVIISKLSTRETILKVKEYGIKHFIVKPLTEKALVNKMRELINN